LAKQVKGMFRNILVVIIIVLNIQAFAMEPTKIVNGLAMYKIGSGTPVFVVPYPHAGTFVSIADDEITKVVLSAGKSVITFDPPGAYNSIRPARVDMQEMIDCINETLKEFEIVEPIDMLGHSMGSFCALAYAVHFPEKVNRLVLVGCTSGWGQQKRYGVHKSWKWWHDKQFWQSRYWGAKNYLGITNLATYNKLNNIVFEASFVNKKYFRPFPVIKGDKKLDIPVRGKWLKKVSQYDYHNKLDSIQLPVLICAGTHDVQTPLIMNQQIHKKTKNSSLIIFENSGHFPFIEESDFFINRIKDFLK
jgi:proline iminopeptidase